MSEWRSAGPTDAEALTDLERDANLVALAHVFPPERYPFPWAEVHARWRETLAESGVVVEVVDGVTGLDAYAARDPAVLRHLAVRPGRWGQGLAREAVERAVSAGARSLWCLVENHRAREFYRHLGYHETGTTREAVWPPHPVEIEYHRDEPARAPDASSG